MYNPLNKVLKSYEQNEKQYTIKAYSLQEYLNYYAHRIETLKNCEKCGGKGYIVPSDEERAKLIQDLRKLDDVGSENNNYFYRISREKIIKAIESRVECNCKKDLEQIINDSKIMQQVINKENLNLNLIWDTESNKFENMTDFRTHYILSLLAQFMTPLKTYRNCASLWIYDYLITKEKLIEMPDYDFIYLICSDIAMNNRDWIIANLSHKCNKFFMYKVKSEQEIRL